MIAVWLGCRLTGGASRSEYRDDGLMTVLVPIGQVHARSQCAWHSPCGPRRCYVGRGSARRHELAGPMAKDSEHDSCISLLRI